ncbi:hypothetical protein D3C81_1319760 [compost metagenome]
MRLLQAEQQPYALLQRRGIALAPQRWAAVIERAAPVARMPHDALGEAALAVIEMPLPARRVVVDAEALDAVLVAAFAMQREHQVQHTAAAVQRVVIARQLRGFGLLRQGVHAGKPRHIGLAQRRPPIAARRLALDTEELAQVLHLRAAVRQPLLQQRQVGAELGLALRVGARRGVILAIERRQVVPDRQIRRIGQVASGRPLEQLPGEARGAWRGAGQPRRLARVRQPGQQRARIQMQLAAAPRDLPRGHRHAVLRPAQLQRPVGAVPRQAVRCVIGFGFGFGLGVSRGIERYQPQRADVGHAVDFA